MKKVTKNLLLLLVLAAGMCTTAFAQEKKNVRVVCVGASITEGATTANPVTDSYPAQLGRLLGDGYEVFNYGVGGTTMLKNGNHPYWTKGRLQEALASAPDILFIDLGGNDSKAMNRPYMHEFVQDACEMITLFAELPSKPRIILLTPIVSFVPDSNDIWDETIVNDVTPATIKAAKKMKVEYINMHPVLDTHPALMKDGIHPDATGSCLMALEMYNYLKKHPKKK